MGRLHADDLFRVFRLAVIWYSRALAILLPVVMLILFLPMGIGRANYLSVVGPSPLRFQDPPKPIMSIPEETHKHIPEPHSSHSGPEFHPPMAAGEPVAITTNFQETITVRSPAPLEPSIFQFLPPLFAHPFAEQEPGARFTPQMFLKFFQASSAGTNKLESLPGNVTFNPPQPEIPPKSKAGLISP